VWFKVSYFTTEGTEATEPDRIGMGWVLSGPTPFFLSDLCVLCALCGEKANYTPTVGIPSARAAVASVASWVAMVSVARVVSRQSCAVAR
jgi:hypothetical protein